jgi:CheY-like chemotaxis protein
MKKLRVLVADDNDEIRSLIVVLLCQEFQVVGAVCDGEELVRAAICLFPDVIVSDILMPRMDGPAARKRLISQQRAIPFVLVSTHGKEVMQFLPSDSPVALVHKDDILGHLSSAVTAVFTGQSYLSPHYNE